MSSKAPKENHARREPSAPTRAQSAVRSTNEPETSDVVLEDFSISATWDKRSVRVSFSGNADLAARDALAHFLTKIHGQAQKRRVSTVICDLGKLYFMNSACFKCFVVWINDVVSTQVSAQYSVRFVRNPQLQWQMRTLESLRCFGPAVVFIEASS